MFYEVMTLKRGARDGGALTYSAGDALPELAPGQVVEVPFGRGKTVAVVVKKVAQPDFATKPIIRIIYSTPLPAHLVKTAQFVAEYYQAPLSSAVGLILPKGVEKKRRKQKTEQTEQFDNKTEREEGLVESPEIKLNLHQKNALQGLQKAVGATKLLHGVTGSGKTNIYLKMAENALKQQKSVILLVPEIALTGQLVRIFSEVFGENVSLIHSGQTEAERHLIFEGLLESEKPRIVVGPRSALFAPLKDLGLIIIDEEHEATYSQEITPKYSAIRVASYVAQILKCDCVLGSATPTVADYYLAEKKQAVVPLNVRAKSTARKADIKIIDFKNREEFSRNRYFSNSLLKAMKRNLEMGQQTLIFHNRRGSAPLTICENCGEELACPHCFLPLTLHADKYELVCHTCGHCERVPNACPKCGSPEILHKGFGTKLLETELTRLFHEARVRRFDADNKKGEGLEAVYDEVRSGEVDILVGTQTLAKGLDLPRLATVGVVQADAGLALPDYVAEERAFQLLTQVIGRVGRGHLDTAEVFIQTFRPEHPVINYAVAENYADFYKYMLKRRKVGGFPPFMFVAKCEITMKTEAVVLRKVRMAVQKLTGIKEIVVSPPMPAFHEHTISGYTWQIIVRAKSRKKLVEALSDLDPSFRITLDPPGLL
ncbi:primosomal protein N' [Candidatus Saccharibacteria bacterium]|nr:primosomal protein N' [Candidatus Saccharibacteria bacterium]